jgi:hypothetical protein
MPHLPEAARDIAKDFLAAVGTGLYLMGFFGALYTALDKLAY